MNKLYYLAKAISKEFKWIAKDDDETVVVARNKPVKVDGSWEDGYCVSCIEINMDAMSEVFKDDMFSDLKKDNPINLDNIRDERYAIFTNDELRDIHRALISQARIYAEKGWQDNEKQYSELAKRVLATIHYDEGKHHIGERGVSADGVGMEIVSWKSKVNITVKFDTGKVLHQQNYKKFKDGKIFEHRMEVTT